MTEQPEIGDVKSAEKVFDHMEDADIRNRLDQIIDRGGNYVCLLFLVGMAVSVFEIISRYVFDAPTLWAHETTIMLVAISFAYGGSYCLARNSHISIRYVIDQLSPGKRQVIECLNALMGFVYTAAIAYAAFEMVRKSLWTPQGVFRLETSGSAWNQPIPPIVKSGLLFCIGLMAIQNVLYLVQTIRGDSSTPQSPSDGREAS